MKGVQPRGYTRVTSGKYTHNNNKEKAPKIHKLMKETFITIHPHIQWSPKKKNSTPMYTIHEL